MIEPHSQTWVTVSEFAAKAIEDARLTLEQPGLDPQRSDYARGEIGALKAVLALAEPKQTIEPPVAYV
jgi:hypothetical protein